MRADATGRPAPSSTRRRVVALVVAAVTIASGLLVHRALPDSAASDIAGDALYALLIYALAVGVAPHARVRVVAAAALVWCMAVELLQLTGWPERAGAVFLPAMLVLGTAFDPRDLLVYVVTVAAAAGADAAQRRIRSRFTARRPR